MAWYDYLSPAYSGGALYGAISGDGNPIPGFSELPGKARGLTDSLGITTPAPPDLTKTPEFARIAQAADAFNADYGERKTEAQQTRGLDLDTIAQLQAAASGKEPSAAEALMRKTVDQNARQSLGIAATLGGNNPGMALRAGLDAYGNAGAKSAADIAALRAQEMERARAMLAEQTAGAANRDTGARANAANTFANTTVAPYQAMRDNQAMQQQNAAANSAGIGKLIGTGATLLAASDETIKHDVAPGGGVADDFLDSLSPQTYKYDRPGPNAPPGQRLGVMAQDLPRHDVTTGPDGKQWISASVISDILAGLGRVHERQSAMEGKRPVAGTAAGSAPEYAAAMDYLTAPPVDARLRARAEGGMPPGPRSFTDDELDRAAAFAPRQMAAAR